MGPLVRRSWQPRGQPPVLIQRGRRLEKVSAIAALGVPPRREVARLYFRRHPQAEIGAAQVIGFLRHLNQERKGPCVLGWDRLHVPRAQRTAQGVASVQHLHTFFLPAYAPALNPVEYAWGYLKMNPLAHRPTFETAEWAALTHRHARALQRSEPLLRSSLRHRPLLLRRR